MIYPKFKVGDLVRCKWVSGSAALGVICSEDTDESSLLGTYYRIFYFEDNKEIWGHPRDWDLVQ